MFVMLSFRKKDIMLDALTMSSEYLPERGRILLNVHESFSGRLTR